VSDYAVVDEEELKNYQDYMYSLGALSIIAGASFGIGVVNSSWTLLALSAVLVTVFGVLILKGREWFPTVNKALKYARGDTK